MSADIFAALVAFAFVSSVTPGPNNFMLLAFRREFRLPPHRAAHVRHCRWLCLAAPGGGLWTAQPEKRLRGALLARVPDACIWCSRSPARAYLLYLAWRIAMSRSLDTKQGQEARPRTFDGGGGVPVGQSEGVDDGGHGGWPFYTSPQAPVVSYSWSRLPSRWSISPAFPSGRIRHGHARLPPPTRFASNGSTSPWGASCWRPACGRC